MSSKNSKIHILCKCTWNILQDRSHARPQNKSNTFKQKELLSIFFSKRNSLKLEINYRNKNGKNTNTWRLNNTLLNNQEITEEIKEEIKKIPRDT